MPTNPPNPFITFVHAQSTTPVIGWEAISSDHKRRPDYLLQAQERRDQAVTEWLALTDKEPLPYEEINAAFERLKKAEEEYSAAWEQWDIEKSGAQF